MYRLVIIFVLFLETLAHPVMYTEPCPITQDPTVYSTFYSCGTPQCYTPCGPCQPGQTRPINILVKCPNPPPPLPPSPPPQKNENKVIQKILKKSEECLGDLLTGQLLV